MNRIQMLRPLRERDFALFWTGWTVSLIGDGFFALVLVGGVVTDRFERRKVLIASSILRGACVALLGVLALTGAIELWHIFVIAVFFGAGQAFQGPAAGAIVPDLVPRHLLVQANSLSQFVRQAAFALVGPAVGGVVVHALGVGTDFLVDAATFGFAIAAATAGEGAVRRADVDAARHRRRPPVRA